MLKSLMCVLVLIVAGLARADDAYYAVPVTKLKITEGEITKDDASAQARWTMYFEMHPYVVLDGLEEGYLGDQGLNRNNWAGIGGTWWQEFGLVVARAPEGQAVAGTLYLPKSDWTGMVPVRFLIEPSERADGARNEFYRVKVAHYERLQNEGGPGTAWFRRQATEAHWALGDAPPAENRAPAWPGRDVADTYDLFVGGRAVSENLQLSRDLPAARQGAPVVEAEPPPVPVSAIEGITVASMDWAIKAKPTLDALAEAIPADQHAVFFASFDGLMALADETSEQGLPVFRSVGGRSEDGGIIARYQRQLGLQPTALARILGPKVVKSVAITGSDPYFPTGTDVAVIFESAGDAAALKDVILQQVGASATAVRDAAPVSGEAEGTPYNGMASNDRSVCSYVAVIGKTVVVTNSVGQIVRLAGVQAGKGPSLASLPEYWFFRDRYPIGAGGETGFVFLSDATIRRWCGPAWRIGASRRLRAGAIMADVAAAHMDELVTGVNAPKPVEAETPMRTIGTLTLGPGGVRSRVYGSMNFMTPIAELGITEVAADEAASYKRWRDTYQRNWSWAFDPIGISFAIEKSRLSADMTVMPLIVASQYRTWIDVARGASIAPDAGDPHDTIAHGVFAINRESPTLQNAAGMAQMFAPGVEIDPLGWLGQSVALYADADPFWGELLAAEEPQRFTERNLHRLPVGLCAEVGSALKLTAFLGASRGALEQAAPGMTAWETRKHGEQPYVRVGLSEKAKAESRGGPVDDAALYYAATPRALYISLSEGLIKRAIDRHGKPATDRKPPQPWLGTSMCLQVAPEGLRLLGGSNRSMLRQAEQKRCWSNLAILNEWRRRYSERDPIKVHAEQWGTTLICPGGGTYAWNEKFRTMESTVYGHPGEPRVGPEAKSPVAGVSAGNFGLTFEERGLRARAVLERAK